MYSCNFDCANYTFINSEIDSFNFRINYLKCMYKTDCQLFKIKLFFYYLTLIFSNKYNNVFKQCKICNFGIFKTQLS